MKKVRVMIVEDSATARLFLESVIARDARLELVASVESGEEALAQLDAIRPDVISMDIRLPGLNGLQVTQAIMTRRPTPIVVVSGNVDSDELNISMNALRAGALAVIAKPSGFDAEAVAAMGRKICDTICAMSQVHVIRQSERRQANLGTPHSVLAPPPPAILQAVSPSGSGVVIGIAASTGGPPALVRLLEGLGRNFPYPILLVQHIAPGFLQGFAHWLEGMTRWPVQIARNGEQPRPGHVYVAPEDHHLRLRGRLLAIDQSPLVCSQRPSGTILFESMAQSLGNRAVGVVLTGMGEDGAAGLLRISQAGGYTLAEDASTAVVFGLPAAAAQRGAGNELLPLDSLASRLRDLAAQPVSS